MSGAFWGTVIGAALPRTRTIYEAPGSPEVRLRPLISGQVRGLQIRIRF